VVASPLIESLLSDVRLVIVDDAHSQLEPETLITLSSLNPSQLILVTSDDLPRPICHSVDNCKMTHFNKSLAARLIEREYLSIEMKHQLRLRKFMTDIVSQVFAEK
jgi:hypothetical protein